MRYGPKNKVSTATKTDTQSTSKALMQVHGTWSGSSVRWDVIPTQNPQASTLTPKEIAALKKKHQSENINLARISEVKRLMQQGKTQAQVVRALYGRKGFGERQIKKDMAVLSKIAK